MCYDDSTNTEVIDMTFATRLKALRERAGLSQDKLAKAANLATSTVAKLENAGNEPSWTTVQALAKALNVDYGAFADDAPAEGPARPKRRPKEEAAATSKQRPKKGQ
jgi:transcriptional regulator with XRE-family HTH domain